MRNLTQTLWLISKKSTTLQLSAYLIELDVAINLSKRNRYADGF